MHTFFINTSSNIDASQRHGPLFDSLSWKKKLVIINCELDMIHICAETISNMITRDDEIDEMYNIIVYVEIADINESALAMEKVTALIIEEDLFSALFKYGRRPNKALILYGENFTRDAEYGAGEEYKKNLQRVLWSTFPLPEARLAAEIINSFTLEQPGALDIREGNDTVYKALVSEATENSLLSTDSDFVTATLYVMLESVKNDTVTDNILFEELFKAFENQKDCARKQVTSEKVMYAHVRLTDSDNHAKDRSEYRILLFVYRCAQTDEISLVEPVNTSNDFTIGGPTIPYINWPELATQLKKSKAKFKNKLDGLSIIAQKDKGFPMFDKQLLDEPIIYPVCQDIPELISSVKAHIGLTIQQLSKTVENTLDDVRRKNDNNEKIVKDYATIITHNFNVNKETFLRNMEIKLPHKFIKNDDLTKSFIAEHKDKSDTLIIAHQRLSLAAERIDDTINETEHRMSYFFDCVKKSKLTYIFCIMFTLLIAIPYIVIQKGVFDTAYGWLFFSATVGAVIAIYIFAYSIFIYIYKFKIIREIRLLCDRFAQAQQEKQECLGEYVKLISHDLPLSFCVKAYETEFSEYLKYTVLEPQYITYHKRQLENYIRYTDNTISNLALTSLGIQENAISNDYDSQIILDKDISCNDLVYSFSSVTSDDSIFLSTEENGRG